MAKSLRRKLREISLEGAYSAEETARSIIEERTRHLAARQLVNSAPSAPTTSVLLCGAGGELYGIALSDVAEVLPVQTCVPIPEGPPALVGILGRRGHPVSVLDLGLALGAAVPADAAFHHFVLLRREHPRIALRVERAHGVAAAATLDSNEGHVFRSDAVIGYAETHADTDGQSRILSLLDVERLIDPFLTRFTATGV